MNTESISASETEGLSSCVIRSKSDRSSISAPAVSRQYKAEPTKWRFASTHSELASTKAELLTYCSMFTQLAGLSAVHVFRWDNIPDRRPDESPSCCFALSEKALENALNQTFARRLYALTVPDWAWRQSSLRGLLPQVLDESIAHAE